MKKHLGIAALILATATTLALAANVPTLSGPGGSGPGVTPQPEFAVLWDQPLSATDTNTYANQEFGDFPTFSCWVADDFVVPAAGWSIDAIFVPSGGWNGATTIACGSMLHFEIWADAAGLPAGYPGSGSPVWSLAVAPTDGQITISNGSGGIPTNVLATLTTPASVPAGTYWFMFYLTADFATCGQFGRQAADTTNGLGTQWINPGGGFGNGTAWQSWSILGATLQDAAFRLEGTSLPVELQTFTAE